MRVAANMDIGQQIKRSLVDQLAMAIDAQHLLKAMREEWQSLHDAGVSIVDCSIERLHLRGDGSFVLSYDVELAKNGETFTQKMFGVLPLNDPMEDYHQAILRLRKNRRTQLTKRGQPYQVGLISRPDLILRFAGLDEKIDGLKLYHAPDQFLSELPNGIAAGLSGNLRTELLAHRLHRRAVIRFSDQNQGAQASSFVLKLYKHGSDHCTKVCDAVRFLERSSFDCASPVRVPSVVCILERWPGLVMNDVPGVPVSDFSGEERHHALALAGEALGRLHRLPMRLETTFGPQQETTLLGGWIDLVAGLWPKRLQELNECYAKVCSLLSQCSAFELSLIHRDFHERQVLVHGQTAYLIDFDTLCNGDPAQDVGNFLAHLELAEMQGELSNAAECSAHFLDRYRSAAGSCNPAHINAHRISTLLRLSCIYSFSSRWAHLAPRLLQRILQDTVPCGIA